MVRETWNSVHAVHKQVVQEASPVGKQCFKGFFLVKFWKASNINYINWITGIEFHKLQILEVCLLDNCVLYQCWKFNNIRLKPCKDIVREILVIGLLVILRNTALKFSFGLWEPTLALRTGWGAEGKGREVCRKVLHKCFIEYPNTHQSEMLTKYKERIRWYRKQCSGPRCKILISTHL